MALGKQGTDMLNQITIQGYKSIKSLENFPLGHLNILIGANGVGKSNFISIFKFLNLIHNRQLQAHVADKGMDSFLHFGRKQTQEIYLEFVFGENAYDITLIPTQENQLLIKHESLHYCPPGYKHSYPIGDSIFESNLRDAQNLSSSTLVAHYCQKGIKEWKLYHFHDTGETSPIKGTCSSIDDLVLKSDAQNLCAYLKRLYNDYQSHYNQIIEAIQSVAPFFGGFVFRDSEVIQLEWFEQSDPDTPFKAHMLSDGTLRFICLATLLLQPFELMPETIIIDEPELGLHPYAINLLSEIIKRASQKKQLIISSQSVELINLFEPENIIVVDRNQDQSSIFRRLNNAELQIWLEDYSLGEIWKSNLIGGRP